jgi:hypothetical protein
MEDTVWTMQANLENSAAQINLVLAEELIRENVLALCQQKTKKLVFEESYTLNRMAHTCGKFFKDKKFAKREKIRRLNREVKRLKRSIITRYGIIHVYSFTIPLYDDNHGNYFYDRKGPDGEPNLYKGDKKKLKKELEKEEELEYTSLDGLTIEKINELILRQFSKKRFLPSLKKSLYSYVGIDATINSRTLNKQDIPELRVVLFFGAKRLQGIKTTAVN